MLQLEDQVFFLVVRASNGAQWCCEPCNWESSHIKSYDCPKGTLKTSIFLDYRTISSQKLKQNKLMYSREFIESTPKESSSSLSDAQMCRLVKQKSLLNF